MGEKHHLDVHLGSRAYEIGLAVILHTPQVGREIVSEQAELYIVRIALERSEIIEADWAEIDFTCRLQVTVSTDFGALPPKISIVNPASISEHNHPKRV